MRDEGRSRDGGRTDGVTVSVTVTDTVTARHAIRHTIRHTLTSMSNTCCGAVTDVTDKSAIFLSQVNRRKQCGAGMQQARSNFTERGGR